jgi:hypothetical protein
MMYHIAVFLLFYRRKGKVMAVSDVGLGNGHPGESGIMELFETPLHEDYRLFSGTSGAQMGISTPLAIAPGGLREVSLTGDVRYDREGNHLFDGSFVAGCECDPRRIVQREELVRLCNGFIESLPDERSRAIIRACFWEDDAALKLLGLDARQIKRQVAAILVELRRLLQLLEFSPDDF